MVSTVAGNVDQSDDFENGIGTKATFNYPAGIAVDSAGNVWVADTYNHMIRKINATGTVSPAFNIVECMLMLVCCVVS